MMVETPWPTPTQRLAMPTWRPLAPVVSAEEGCAGSAEGTLSGRSIATTVPQEIGGAPARWPCILKPQTPSDSNAWVPNYVAGRAASGAAPTSGLEDWLPSTSPKLSCAESAATLPWAAAAGS